MIEEDIDLAMEAMTADLSWQGWPKEIAKLLLAIAGGLTWLLLLILVLT